MERKLERRDLPVALMLRLGLAGDAATIEYNYRNDIIMPKQIDMVHEIL